MMEPTNDTQMNNPEAQANDAAPPAASAPPTPEAPAAPAPPASPAPPAATLLSGKVAPNKAPSYLHNAKPETVVGWAKRELGLTLPESTTRDVGINAINAKLGNLHRQTALRGSTPSAPAAPSEPPIMPPSAPAAPQGGVTDPETAALPPGEGDTPAQPLPGRPERFTREIDPATHAPQAPPPNLAGRRAVGLPGRGGEGVQRDTDPRMPAFAAAVSDNPTFSHLAARGEDGQLDPEVLKTLEGVPQHLLANPKKVFRHPQEADWLFNAETKVYWYPTELLMRNERLIPVMGEPPVGSVFGSLPPDLKKPPGGGRMQGAG